MMGTRWASRRTVTEEEELQQSYVLKAIQIVMIQYSERIKLVRMEPAW